MVGLRLYPIAHLRPPLGMNPMLARACLCQRGPGWLAGLLPVLFYLTKTETKKHFSKAYFILVIKTITIIILS